MSNLILKSILSPEIHGANDNLQDARPDEVVFYRLNDNQKSEDLFHERLTSSRSKIIVVNKKLAKEALGKKIIVVDETNFLQIQKEVCDKFYAINPALKLVGITGTNGKTTTTHLSLLIAEKLKMRALGIGTLGLTTTTGPLESEFSTTTPSYLQLRRALFKYQDKFDIVFMEVSSHALKQDRVYQIQFDAAAWTNFTQDHLDYHQTMDDYFESKCLLLNRHLKTKSHFFVPSSQEELKQKIEKKRISKNAVLFAKSLPTHWLKDRPVFFQNSYNIENLELAYSLNAHVFGKNEIDFANISLDSLSGPEGRFSTIINNCKMVVVDYAHTPDAILNVAASVTHNFKGRPVSILFGCGGNRDKSKRPKMAEAAQKYSEKIYVTSDNPRFEEPQDIINDIIKGNTSKNITIEVDRKKAILIALERMTPDEILLILGKGHEKYQEIKGQKNYFSDFDIVSDYFKSKG